jgi:putative transposase
LRYISRCHITVSMTISKYKSNRNVVYSCKYHVVWCPKYRRSVLNDFVQKELKSIIEEVCGLRRSEILAVELMPDHVHLLVEVDPQYGIHKLIKEIKGKSSRILRQRFPHLRSRLPTLWTNSYFVSTVGGAPLSVIKQYVENQKAV